MDISNNNIINLFQKLKPAPVKELIQCLEFLNTNIENGLYYLDLTKTPIKINLKKIIPIFNNYNYIQIISSHEPVKFNSLLVYDKQKLYFTRYYQYERIIVQTIYQKLKTKITLDLLKLQQSLHKYFPNLNPQKIDWQAIAVLQSLRYNFSIITGGPGTGKTTTAVKLLACFIEQYPDAKVLIAAPTGKAASRLLESIKNACEKIEHIPKQIASVEALTLHRALRLQEYGNVKLTKLNYDLVLLDEASMLDIELFVLLMQSLHTHTKLVMLGDRFQLPAIGLGRIFEDLTAAKNSLNNDDIRTIHRLLTPDWLFPDKSNSLGYVTVLQQSFRFGNDSELGKLAFACNNGDIAAFMSVFTDAKHVTLTHKTERDIIDYFTNFYKQFINICHKEDTETVFKHISSFMLLATQRGSSLGVDNLNKQIEAQLNPNYKNIWYVGRLVIVRKNDYNLQLFNGDIGVCLLDKNRKMAVYFQTIDGYKAYNPNILNNFDVAFAITVHQAQGSEFENVAIIMPDKDHKLNTRNMLYTAITRAKNTCYILGSYHIIANAISNTQQTQTNINDKLLNLIT